MKLLKAFLKACVAILSCIGFVVLLIKFPVTVIFLLSLGFVTAWFYLGDQF